MKLITHIYSGDVTTDIFNDEELPELIEELARTEGLFGWSLSA